MVHGVSVLQYKGWFMLDYGEEVHQSVKNSNSKTRLFEAMIGMTDKMKTITFILSWLSRVLGCTPVDSSIYQYIHDPIHQEANMVISLHLLCNQENIYDH
jgi:hypothetical protein